MKGECSWPVSHGCDGSGFRATTAVVSGRRGCAVGSEWSGIRPGAARYSWMTPPRMSRRTTSPPEMAVAGRGTVKGPNDRTRLVVASDRVVSRGSSAVSRMDRGPSPGQHRSETLDRGHHVVAGAVAVGEIHRLYGR